MDKQTMIARRLVATNAKVQAHLTLTAEMRDLERSMAYEHASGIIDGESYSKPDGWMEVDIEGEVEIFDAVRYLEWRGLVERHAQHSNWIKVREESEATN